MGRRTFRRVGCCCRGRPRKAGVQLPSRRAVLANEFALVHGNGLSRFDQENEREARTHPEPATEGRCSVPSLLVFFLITSSERVARSLSPYILVLCVCECVVVGRVGRFPAPSRFRRPNKQQRAARARRERGGPSRHRPRDSPVKEREEKQRSSRRRCHAPRCHCRRFTCRGGGGGGGGGALASFFIVVCCCCCCCRRGGVFVPYRGHVVIGSVRRRRPLGVVIVVVAEAEEEEEEAGVWAPAPSPVGPPKKKAREARRRRATRTKARGGPLAAARNGVPPLSAQPIGSRNSPPVLTQTKVSRLPTVN